MLDQMIKKAIKEDKKNIKDDLHLLAWLWTTQDYKATDSPEWNTRMGKLYTFLLTHFNPESVVREKRLYLNAHPELLPFAESTDSLKRGILNNEQTLPFGSANESPASETLAATGDNYTEGRKILGEMRAKLKDHLKSQNPQFPPREPATQSPKIELGSQNSPSPANRTPVASNSVCDVLLSEIQAEAKKEMEKW